MQAGSFAGWLVKFSCCSCQGCEASLCRYSLFPLSSSLSLWRCSLADVQSRPASQVLSYPVTYQPDSSCHVLRCLPNLTKSEFGNGRHPTVMPLPLAWPQHRAQQSWAAQSFTPTLLTPFSPVVPMPKCAGLMLILLPVASLNLKSSTIDVHVGCPLLGSANERHEKTRASQKHNCLLTVLDCLVTVCLGQLPLII